MIYNNKRNTYISDQEINRHCKVSRCSRLDCFTKKFQNALVIKSMGRLKISHNRYRINKNYAKTRRIVIAKRI